MHDVCRLSIPRRWRLARAPPPAAQWAHAATVIRKAEERENVDHYHSACLVTNGPSNFVQRTIGP